MPKLHNKAYYYGMLDEACYAINSQRKIRAYIILAGVKQTFLRYLQSSQNIAVSIGVEDCYTGIFGASLFYLEAAAQLRNLLSAASSFRGVELIDKACEDAANTVGLVKCIADSTAEQGLSVLRN